MISKATAKFIKSLQLKKFRQQHQAFLVEGAKSVQELLYARFPVKIIVATSQFISENSKILHGLEVYEVKASELHTLGTLKSNNAALAVADIVWPPEPDWQSISYALMLDNINDPGNFGTIIRIADWYGMPHIIASEQTAELHNPKVISASKGSFLRVNIYYRPLAEFIKKNPKPLVGTFMEGESVHQFNWPDQGYIIMGNEANGISAEIENFVDQRITIPGGGGTESLNVAIATAVVCDNWWRGS
jgi:TrmH family RNA methyltransferase